MPITGSDFLRSLDHEDYYGSFIRVTAPDGTEFERRNLIHDRGPEARTEEWQIHFWWHWDTSYEANWGVIRIFNLDNNRIKKFSRGDTVKLQAGWQRRHENSILSINGSIIFVGEYRQANVVRGTEIFFVDAPKNTNVVTSRAWRPGTLYSTRFNDLLGDTGMSADINKPRKDSIYKDGVTTLGRAWDSMLETSKDMESKLYVYNGAVRLLPYGEGLPNGPEISLKTDQVEKVKRVFIEQEDVKAPINILDYEKKMLKIRMVLEPQMGPDVIFSLGEVRIDAMSELGTRDTEIGDRRAIKGTTWSDERSFHTEVLCVPKNAIVPTEDSIIDPSILEPDPNIKPQGGGTNPGQAMEDLWGWLEDFGGNAEDFMDEFFGDLPFYDEVKEFFDDTISDLIDAGVDYALDQGMEFAKGFVSDALSSVGIPAPAIFAGIDAVGKLASGDVAGALGTLADGAMDSIPGVGIAKTIAGMAAPFFTGD